MPSYLLDARAAATHFPGIGRYVSNLTREMAARLEPDEALWLLVDSRRQAGWPLPEPVDGRVRWIDAPFPSSPQRSSGRSPASSTGFAPPSTIRRTT